MDNSRLNFALSGGREESAPPMPHPLGCGIGEFHILPVASVGRLHASLLFTDDTAPTDRQRVTPTPERASVFHHAIII